MELTGNWSMVNVKVKLFAAYQEVCGKSELTLSFPEATTVGDVLNYLIQERPELEKWREVTRFGINLQFVSAETVIRDGDEIVLIPPVSGG
ncbi:MoaD family protein [Xenococcus sp. PCC 7305]|uniref:MoaD/ThiS family protein n=1 Tax=Xenococcus sp. PCC 7305 TaxID=102125 RepID=UPI0002AD0D95|nr:MoaD/ThiS family protein [Xenococcus sp. PCC 7305]ELS03551.1 MoaD family protein [Xenococcus sp. PCC 7305]